MGGTLSKLSFDSEEYLSERIELAALLREVADVAAKHRKTKGTWQVINGASGVTSGVAGAVALGTAMAPLTLGVSVPATAVLASAIVSNSIGAAALTTSVASYGYGQQGDAEIERRLNNLKHFMESIAQKDEEIYERMKLENDESTVESFRQNQPDTGQPKNIPLDLTLTVLKTSGLIMGARSIMQGKKELEQEQGDLEADLRGVADTLDEETITLSRKLRWHRNTTRNPPRGRLTLVELGNGSPTMVAKFTPRIDTKEEAICELRSDQSQTLLLPEGVWNVRVHFEVQSTVGAPIRVKKVNRADPRQPWVKDDQNNDYKVDVFYFECGDGIDAVFVLQWSLTGQPFVAKAWDFGRENTRPRHWEWWGEAREEECLEMAPRVQERIAKRRKRRGHKKHTTDDAEAAEAVPLQRPRLAVPFRTRFGG